MPMSKLRERRKARGARRGKRKSRRRAAISGLLLLALVYPLSPALGQTSKADPPIIRDDLGRDSLALAVRRSLDFLARLPGGQVVGTRPKKSTAAEAKESLQSFTEALALWDRPQKLAEAIRVRFDLSPSVTEPGRELLVTGYYQPVVEGSLSESAAYPFPVYRKPDDLPADGAPYYSRREIDVFGRLKGKGAEIAWVKSWVDLFFLQLQGSGILRLEGGETVHLNYAASNNRPYLSIGKVLIDEGKIPAAEMSAARLRKYLAEHPEAKDGLLPQNERYVFFRFLEGGPFGSLGVPVTPGRSIAVDPDYFPKGGLGFLESRMPVLDAAGNLAGWRPFSRFVLAQDTGSAIRGPARADLYFGGGEEAGGPAGFMKSGGRLYLLSGKNSR